MNESYKPRALSAPDTAAQAIAGAAFLAFLVVSILLVLISL
jgi:hypothetical protein